MLFLYYISLRQVFEVFSSPSPPGTVVGVVIYTGKELRSVMNTSNPRHKVQKCKPVPDDPFILYLYVGLNLRFNRC